MGLTTGRGATAGLGMSDSGARGTGAGDPVVEGEAVPGDAVRGTGAATAAATAAGLKQRDLRIVARRRRRLRFSICATL